METQIAVWNWRRRFCMIWHFIFFWQILSPGLHPRHQVWNSSSDFHTAGLAAAVSGASGVLSITLFLKWFPKSSFWETRPVLLRMFVADRSLQLTCLQRRHSHYLLHGNVFKTRLVSHSTSFLLSPLTLSFYFFLFDEQQHTSICYYHSHGILFIEIVKLELQCQ